MRNVLMLVTLAALWGGSFLFLRVASPVLGPFVTVVLRVSIAAATLILISIVSRRPLDLRRHWRAFLVMGLLNSAIPFSLISAAEVNLSASFGSILNASTTFFTALVAALWLHEPLTRAKIAGIVIGMLGVVVLVGWDPAPLTLTTILSVGAVLIATLSYGLAAVFARTAIKGIASYDFAVGQQLAATVLIFPFALLSAPAVQLPPPSVIVAILGLGILSTAFAYLLYFRLIANLGPTPALSVTFLIPVFGILWGRLFLGESISANLLAGLAIILVGMTLVLQVRLPLSRIRSAHTKAVTQA